MIKYSTIFYTFLWITFFIPFIALQANNPNRFSRAFSHLSLRSQNNLEQRATNKPSTSRSTSPRTRTAEKKKLNYNKKFILSKADTRGDKCTFEPRK